jgi:hypothetical protein
MTGAAAGRLASEAETLAAAARGWHEQLALLSDLGCTEVARGARELRVARYVHGHHGRWQWTCLPKCGKEFLLTVGSGLAVEGLGVILDGMGRQFQIFMDPSTVLSISSTASRTSASAGPETTASAMRNCSSSFRACRAPSAFVQGRVCIDRHRDLDGRVASVITAQTFIGPRRNPPTPARRPRRSART